MFSLLFVTFLCIQCNLIFAAVPNVSQKCKMSDSECLKTVAQNIFPSLAVGVPELNIEPLDVMRIDERKFEMGRLKLTVSDAFIKGLKNAVVTNFSYDLKKNVLTAACRTDLEVRSKYISSGHLLILPISGDGDMSIDLKNLHIKMTVPFEITKNSEGKDVIELKSYDFTYDVKDGAHFDLTNLFNGNKELSNKLLTFMNDKWKTLTLEFGKPMLDEVVKKIFVVVKTYLGTRPVENYLEI